MGTENLSLYEQWFKVADEDHDGKIAGAEAVKFFQRSGLPQPVLSQIWQTASAGSPALTKPQFSSAMQLVSLAQQSNGAIDSAVARQITVGLGPRLPAPKMTGLAAPKPLPGASGNAGWGAPGAAKGGGFPLSGSTGGYFTQPSGYPAGGGMQQLGGYQYYSGPTGGPGCYPGAGPTGGNIPSSGPTGGGYPGAGPTAGYPGAGPTGGLPGAPPMTAQQEQQYARLFASLDPGRSGSVQGQAVFPVFSSSGLPRDKLRHIWSLAAGNKGALNQQEFISAHYLVDLARRGLPLPPQLPLGPFPPRAGVPQQPQQQPGGLPHDMQQQVLSPTQAPVEDPIAVVNDAFASLGASLGVPQHLISGPSSVAAAHSNQPILGPTEDMQAFGVTDPADLPHRKKEFYEKSLQDVTLFKRRVESQLLQVEGGSTRSLDEADTLEKQYKKLHGETVQSAEGAALLEQKIEEAIANQEEAQHRFEELNRRRHHIANVKAEDVLQDEAAADAAEQKVLAAEQRLGELKDLADGGASRRGELEAYLQAADAKVQEAHAQVDASKAELDELKTAYHKARQTGAGEELQSALKGAVALHSQLLQELAAKGVALPAGVGEANPQAGLVWKMDTVAEAAELTGPAGASGNGHPPQVRGAAQDFAKGDMVWYVKNDSRVEGIVVSIDRSLKPPAYTVKLPSGERETESHNLEKRTLVSGGTNGDSSGTVLFPANDSKMMAQAQPAPFSDSLFF